MFFSMSVPQIDAVVASMNYSDRMTIIAKFVLCSRALVL